MSLNKSGRTYVKVAQQYSLIAEPRRKNLWLPPTFGHPQHQDKGIGHRKKELPSGGGRVAFPYKD